MERRRNEIATRSHNSLDSSKQDNQLSPHILNLHNNNESKEVHLRDYIEILFEENG